MKAQEVNSAWDFNADQTKLTIGSTDPSGIKMVELTATILKFRFSEGSGAILETETYTYTAF